MWNRILAFAAGTISAYITAVLFISQLNIARITELGFPVSFAERIATLLDDIGGMSQVYLPLVAVALLVAWLFTGLLLSRFVRPSALLYAAAGFVGILAVHLLMNNLLGIAPVAPTRTPIGLLSQGAAGAVGGWLYYVMVSAAGLGNSSRAD